jgi:hypothetical protein
MEPICASGGLKELAPTGNGNSRQGRFINSAKKRQYNAKYQASVNFLKI